MLNDDGIAGCGFLEIFMTRKVLVLLSGVSRDSTKPTKVIASRKMILEDYEKRYSSIKLLKDEFE